jgi:hypothetical protein
MNRKLVITISLVMILSSLFVKTTFAEESTNVSYIPSFTLSSRGGDPNKFTINVTLDFEVTYSNVVENSTCHLNVTPNSAILYIDYDIHHLIGNKQIQLSSEQLSQLVTPFQGLYIESIPIESGDYQSRTHYLDLHIYGKLVADFDCNPTGSAYPDTIQWESFTPQDTVVSSYNSQVTLEMDTQYEASILANLIMSTGDSTFTFTTSYFGLETSTVIKPGSISPTFTINLPHPSPTGSEGINIEVPFIIAVVVIVGVALLLKYRRRK